MYVLALDVLLGPLDLGDFLNKKCFTEYTSFLASDNRHKWMPFPERKLMTNDFVIPGGSHESDAPSAPLNTPVYGSLGCVPVPSQENALVQDLLFCFIGVPGNDLI